VSDVADQVAGDHVRELIYRAVLLASEWTGTGKLYLSLAGGRKTMSADLQRAGMVIGCHALLHVIAPPFKQMTERMRTADPEIFAIPLQREDYRGLLPLVVGRGRRSELLDIESPDNTPVNSEYYPLPLPDDGVPLDWAMEKGKSLPAEIERREREGSRLLGNYLHALATTEHHENWRSLYRLPPSTIERLRNVRLINERPPWLKAIPKADLHRHIGGCLDIAAQRRVGRAIWDDLNASQRAAALERVRPLLQKERWEWRWPELLKAGERSHNAAALLVEADDTQLERNLFDETEPRHALQAGQRGFQAYERPGELAGSAVLTHPAALEPYVEGLLEGARSEGLRYLELRGSPQKYRTGRDRQIDFLRQVQRTASRYQDLTLRFIIIADRRNLEQLTATIDLAVKASRELDGFVVGLDLAGDEMKDDDERMQKISRAFEPAFEACLPITIHAGEGTPADMIWNAAYRLHADRVGHGLTLIHNEPLLQRFRDRGICVELCPTSNEEVVGFDEKPYPLGDYWKRGVPLTICTDNPAISRTDA